VKGFDGLRAVAALFVFIEHKVRDLGTGVIGVWVFFCLSGYLIVGILHRARAGLERSPGAGSLRRALLDFWRNRALRILPIYYVVLFLVFAFTHVEAPRAFPYYFFYLQNFYIAFVTHGWSAISHFWSLAIEQQFYILSAPVLLLVACKAHARFLVLVLSACVALALLAELRSFDPMVVSLMPPTNFAFMALGGIVYLEPPGSLVRRALARTSVLAVATLAFSAAFLATRAAYDPLGGTAFSVYLVGLFFAVAVVGWTAERPLSRFVGFLETAPMRWLGTISYGFYVIHPFMPSRERVARLVAADFVHAIPLPLWIALELAGALALSHVSWRYFESRFLALKKKRALPQGTT